VASANQLIVDWQNAARQSFGYDPFNFAAGTESFTEDPVLGSWVTFPNTLHETLVPWKFVCLAPTMRHSPGGCN